VHATKAVQGAQSTVKPWTETHLRIKACVESVQQSLPLFLHVAKHMCIISYAEMAGPSEPHLHCQDTSREEDHLAKVWKKCRLLEAHFLQELEVLDLQGCASARPATRLRTVSIPDSIVVAVATVHMQGLHYLHGTRTENTAVVQGLKMI
jgi:hypothetical protein